MIGYHQRLEQKWKFRGLLKRPFSACGVALLLVLTLYGCYRLQVKSPPAAQYPGHNNEHINDVHDLKTLFYHVQQHRLNRHNDTMKSIEIQGSLALPELRVEEINENLKSPGITMNRPLNQVLPNSIRPSVRIEEFFQKRDGLEITWYHAANSQAKLKQALDGKYHMIEGDVQLRWYGLQNETTEPIMAHPPDVDSDLTLQQFVNSVMAHKNKGIKLDFKSIEVVEPSLKILGANKDKIHFPVFLNADIVQIAEKPVDAQRFLQLVNEYFSDATLSLGWTLNRQASYSPEIITQMWEVCKAVAQPISFAVCLPLMPAHWTHFKWLLQKNNNSLSITLWTISDPIAWQAATIYQLLAMRNDIPKHLLYYDLESADAATFAEFLQLSTTGGTPLNYFEVGWDGLMVTWTHANTKAQLKQTIKDGSMMVEGGVTVNEDGIAVMQRPLVETEELTFEQWLEDILGTSSGISIIIQTNLAVIPVLQILKQHKGKYKQPVRVGGNVFNGPDPQNSALNPESFKDSVSDIFPHTTVILGWGGQNNGFIKYKDEDIQDKLLYIKQFKQPVSLRIRISQIKSLWSHLSSWLDTILALTVTIFAEESDVIKVEDLIEIRKQSEKHRIFYDIPDYHRQQILS